MRTVRLWLGIGLLFMVVFAGRTHAQSTPGLKVVVTVAPLRGIVEPLLPAGSTVTVLMPPGRSEHGYEFTAKDLEAVAKADMVVYIGLGLETRLTEALRKHPREGRREVCFADCVGIKASEHEHDGDHNHDGDAEHHHGAVDQHLWLDPVLVGQFVPKLAEHIRASCPEPEKAGVQEREKALIQRVNEVDRTWRSKLASAKGRSIVTHHNAFPRPAARYGLKVASVIRVVENAEPTAGQIAAVVDAIKKEKVEVIFVEPQFNAGTAERIAKAAGVRVATLDPLGDGDWFKLMRSNLDSLVTNLSPK